MCCRIFALLCATVILNSPAFSAQILENFTAVTDGGASITGSLAFDPAAFTPTPVMPDGSVYLTSFAGGTGSVSLQVEGGGAAQSLDANASTVTVCSGCNLAWDLTATSAQGSLNLLFESASPVTFVPGTSIFDLAGFTNPASILLGVVNDPGSTTNFTITGISGATDAPEPASLGAAALGGSVLLAVFVARRRGFVR